MSLWIWARDCSFCRKEFHRGEHRHELDGEVACDACYRNLENLPVTPRQLEMLKRSGFRDETGWTFQTAGRTLERADLVRYFGLLVARQEGKLDMNFNFAPLIQWVLGQPNLVDDIRGIVRLSEQVRDQQVRAHREWGHMENVVIHLPTVDTAYRIIRDALFEV